MKTLTLTALIALVLSPTFPTWAGATPAGERMGDCLVKQTTGQDRIDLVRWIVVAYSKHPDVVDAVSSDPNLDEDIQKQIAAVFSSLMLERCREETMAAFSSDGEAAIGQGFTVLGQVAAEELIRDKNVNAFVLGFMQYVDMDEFEALLE